MSGSELARKRLATLQRDLERAEKRYNRVHGAGPRHALESRIRALRAEIKEREQAGAAGGRSWTK